MPESVMFGVLQNTSSEKQFYRKHAFIMKEVRRKGPDWSKLTVMQITTSYKSGMQKSISEHTTCLTSKWLLATAAKDKVSVFLRNMGKYII